MKNFKRIKKEVSLTIASHAAINSFLAFVAIIAIIIAITEPVYKFTGAGIAIAILVANIVRNFLIVKRHDKKLKKIKTCR